MEMNFGRWEGKPWDDVPRNELDLWASDFHRAKPHGGESVADMQRRVSAAIDDYAAMPGLVLLVTHLGVIRCALVDGAGPEAYDFNVPYGGSIALDEEIPRVDRS